IHRILDGSASSRWTNDRQAGAWGDYGASWAVCDTRPFAPLSARPPSRGKADHERLVAKIQADRICASDGEIFLGGDRALIDSSCVDRRDRGGVVAGKVLPTVIPVRNN